MKNKIGHLPEPGHVAKLRLGVQRLETEIDRNVDHAVENLRRGTELTEAQLEEIRRDTTMICMQVVK